MAKRNQQFQTIRTEGALLPPDVLQSIASLKVDGTSADSYHLPPGTKINEAISQSWNALKQHWTAFKEARGSLGKGSETETGTSVTNSAWLLPLFKELDYGRLLTSKSPVIDDRTYPIERFYNHTPIHLVGCLVPLDRRTKGARGAATASPHSMVQEYLNRSKDHLWAFVSNGLLLRMLRDNISLSRQAFIEFDLESMMEGEVYADFAILWLLCHQSRVESDKPIDSWLEKWSKLASDQGTRVLEDLRNGVAAAIEALGQGFIAHPNNETLRERLRSGELSKDDYYRQILRVVYRLLFLFVAEDRELLHPPLPEGEDRDEGQKARSLYDNYYSTRRLRDLAFRVRGTRHSDLWHSLSLVFDALGNSAGCPQLALRGLGSFLWRDSAIPDLLGPNKSRSSKANSYSLISNEHLLRAIRSLAYIEKDRVVRVVDYRNLGTEELGSVYESLLELHPEVHIEAKGFELKVAAGNERKTSGSYYTPDSLVQCLLDSALEPVVSERLAEARDRASLKARNEEDKIQTLKEFLRALDNNTELAKAIRQEAFGSDSERLAFSISLEKSIEALPLARRNQLLSENAILGMKVCDPACGSGHFLIAAAHRLARHLSRVRTGEVEPTPDEYQRALRDVISRCIHGVDINPMAVELCKVSLWMEAIEPGKPLSFLDHHIQCGNSLLGTTPRLLADGIPNEAFTAIEGDDKKVIKSLKADNKRERDDRASGQLSFFEAFFPLGNLPSVFANLNIANNDSVDDVLMTEKRYSEVVSGTGYANARLLADTWCAAFVWTKDDSELGRLCPTERTFRKVENEAATGLLPHVRAEVESLRGQYQFFHWHLAFPDVFRLPGKDERPENEPTGWSGGFDVVLGNPPWESSDLMKVEFYATLLPGVSEARTTEDRLQIIANAASANPQLDVLWHAAVRANEGTSHVVKNSGLYPFTSGGKLNTYRTFAELFTFLVCGEGQVGVILKSGIVNAQDNQDFFADLLRHNRVVTVFDFINTAGIFADVVANERFCNFTIKGNKGGVERAAFMFGLETIDQVRDEARRIVLSTEELALLNPNDLSVPPLTSARDQSILLVVHRRIPVLVDDTRGRNFHSVRYARGHLNSSTDSGLFAENTFEALRDEGIIDDRGSWDGESVRPLVEGKLIGLYNHRFGTFEGVKRQSRFGKKAEARDPSLAELQTPTFRAIPRFWLRATDAIKLFASKNYNLDWLLTYRHVCRAFVDARTAQVCISPKEPTSDSCALLLIDGDPINAAVSACLIVGAWASFIGDYALRQKIYGPALTKAIGLQLPAPTVANVNQMRVPGVMIEFLQARVLELTYTAWDLEAFALDCRYNGPPFRWNEERRFLLRCELDAAYFHLYLGPPAEWGADSPQLPEMFPTPRDAVDYIMETFPIVRRKDIARTQIKNDSGEITTEGRYITKDTILEIYDQMQQAIDTGTPFQTRLDPLPGPPTNADGNFISIAQWDQSNWPSHIHPLRNKEKVTSG